MSRLLDQYNSGLSQYCSAIWYWNRKIFIWCILPTSSILFQDQFLSVYKLAIDWYWVWAASVIKDLNNSISRAQYGCFYFHSSGGLYWIQTGVLLVFHLPQAKQLTLWVIALEFQSIEHKVCHQFILSSGTTGWWSFSVISQWGISTINHTSLIYGHKKFQKHGGPFPCTPKLYFNVEAHG